MKRIVLFILLIFSFHAFTQKPQLTEANASHFAKLALKCIHQEFPNKPGHVMDNADDVKAPALLHPAFYGCFDWHSSVHGHWMLIRLLKEYPTLPEAAEIREKAGSNLTRENLEKELEYFKEETNKSFERTYGWAWFLKLAEELYTWDDHQGREWYDNIKPLADHLIKKYMDFLPKLTYPNRTGEHPNTAFGLGFAWDYAKAVDDTALISLIKSRARDYYIGDLDCPADYEPGGFDFLSPCLEEANLMARVLDEGDYTKWMEGFLPGLAMGEPAILFEPATVTDRTDGKLVHLDGLNLSRAWCFARIAGSYPPAAEAARKAATRHLEVTLPNIASGDYAGEHWLASFAVYALFSLGN